MKCDTFEGKRFIVTIDRTQMQRRYVLQTLEDDGEFKKHCKPLYSEEFREHFGFEEEWPHKVIK